MFNFLGAGCPERKVQTKTQNDFVGFIKVYARFFNFLKG